MSLKFTAVASNILVSNTVQADLSGGKSTRRFAVTFRIDGRNVERDGYRVDRGGMMGWEAIDGGARNVTSIKAAKALAKSYLAAIEREGTLTPSV